MVPFFAVKPGAKAPFWMARPIGWLLPLMPFVCMSPKASVDDSPLLGLWTSATPPWIKAKIHILSFRINQTVRERERNLLDATEFGWERLNANDWSFGSILIPDDVTNWMVGDTIVAAKCPGGVERIGVETGNCKWPLVVCDEMDEGVDFEWGDVVVVVDCLGLSRRLGMEINFGTSCYKMKNLFFLKPNLLMTIFFKKKKISKRQRHLLLLKRYF